MSFQPLSLPRLIISFFHQSNTLAPQMEVLSQQIFVIVCLLMLLMLSTDYMGFLYLREFCNDWCEWYIIFLVYVCVANICHTDLKHLLFSGVHFFVIMDLREKQLIYKLNSHQYIKKKINIWKGTFRLRFGIRKVKKPSKLHNGKFKASHYKY
jgi:hypothetical protein